MPNKASCLQSISFIMRFYFNKYSLPVSSVKKINKELDSYELLLNQISLTAVHVCQSNSFIHVVFNKSVEKFRDDSPSLKYILSPDDNCH